MPIKEVKPIILLIAPVNLLIVYDTEACELSDKLKTGAANTERVF